MPALHVDSLRRNATKQCIELICGRPRAAFLMTMKPVHNITHTPYRPVHCGISVVIAVCTSCASGGVSCCWYAGGLYGSHDNMDQHTPDISTIRYDGNHLTSKADLRSHGYSGDDIERKLWHRWQNLDLMSRVFAQLLVCDRLNTFISPLSVDFGTCFVLILLLTSPDIPQISPDKVRHLWHTKFDQWSTLLL